MPPLALLAIVANLKGSKLPFKSLLSGSYANLALGRSVEHQAAFGDLRTDVLYGFSSVLRHV